MHPADTRDLPPQWLTLLVIIRLAAMATAIVLLAAHRVTEHDAVLGIVGGVWVVLGAAAVVRRPPLALAPGAWAADIGVVLALVVASEDWRSPFFLLALTTLAAPAARLTPPLALALGSAFSLAYAVIAHLIGPDPLQIGAQTTVETLATHLVLPVLLTFGVSFAADAIHRLRDERRRSERLAIEAERRRIAWELHDSAKQRVHAAHLVLDAVARPDDPDLGAAIEQVIAELRAAAAEMDTSLAELRSPLEGRPLHVALRERIAELSVPGGPDVRIRGKLELEPLEAAHAYRIACEALTNAMRHARASQVDVVLRRDEVGAVLAVLDDGIGMPAGGRPGSNGLRVMRNRANAIGGRLAIGPRGESAGTAVELRIPHSTRPQEAT
jgi:signal transduction histidine kinase